ncbi:MAG: CoA transferase [Chloroflexota bacterium]|nr:CoA transferase [Chloroflexota bacterium]
MSDGPLANVRVLEFTDEIGAYCGKLFADLGADVIKIEPPNGEGQRHAPPFLDGDPGPDASIAFWAQNTSKRSLALDLYNEAHLARARELALGADIILEDHLPGSLATVGLGYDDLRGERPDLVYVSITGFGQTGPHANFAYDDIVGQAMGGVMTLAGQPEDPPNLIYGNQGNICASIQAAQGTLVALHHAERTGQGQHVDVSVQEALSLPMETAMMMWDFQHTNRVRTGPLGLLRMPIPGVGVYETQAGYVMAYITAPGGADFPEVVAWMDEVGFEHDLHDEAYTELVHGMNLRFLAQVLSDPESAAGAAGQLAHINDVFTEFLATMTALEAYEEGQRRRLLVGLVSTPRDLVENRQLRDRDWYQPVAVDSREVEFPGPPYRLSATPATVSSPPALGQHDDADWNATPARPVTSPARPRRPLEGVRVADFSWFGAGPIAGQTLASFGAEVVRVESEARIDSLRVVEPAALNEDGSKMTDTYNASGYFNNFNAGKLSFLLDLNSERGQEIAYRLVERSDIFMTNFTPRVLEKWNLLYEHVSAANPRIVAGYAPMQGMVGPHRDFLGFGAVLTPITGISELSGFPHHPPIGIGTNYPDYVVNPGHLAFALLAGLRHRDITGEGQLVEMPQIESVVNALAPAILDYTANGVVQTRAGNRSPVAAPHGVFRCVDDPTSEGSEDRWIAIACRSDEQWAAVCDAFGQVGSASDPRFATHEARKANEDALETLVSLWTADRRAEDVMADLQARGVPAGVVQNAQDILDKDPHVRDRAYYQYLDHPETGRSAYDGPCARLSETPGFHAAPAPLFGQHTDEVCRRILELSDDEVATLLVEGVLA